MLRKQCAICGGAATVPDHNHITGKLRGPLCTHCNLGLGHFHDNPATLSKAAEYLRLYS